MFDKMQVKTATLMISLKGVPSFCATLQFQNSSITVDCNRMEMHRVHLPTMAEICKELYNSARGKYFQITVICKKFNWSKRVMNDYELTAEEILQEIINNFTMGTLFGE